MQELIGKLKTLVNIFEEKRNIETEAEGICKEFEEALHHAVMEDILNSPAFSYTIENDKNAKDVLVITNHHATLYTLSYDKIKAILPEGDFEGHFKYKKNQSRKLYTLKDFIDHLPEYIDQINKDIEEKRKTRDEMAEILERIKAALAPLLVAEKLSQ